MPVTGVTMLANYPQESHCAKARRPPPRSPVRPSAASFIASCARAACAPMAVTMASTRLQGRAPSEPGFEIQREVPLFSSQWDVCKSPGFPSNRVAAGQVDPPAVRITMVCSLFACCLSASEAFLFLSGAVCWVFSNACTIRKNICWFFRGWWSEKGRSYSTQKAARRLRHSAEALVEEAKV